MVMEVLSCCDSFIQHHWKSDVYLNCFLDKEKHKVNGQLVINLKANRPLLCVRKDRLQTKMPARCATSVDLNGTKRDLRARLTNEVPYTSSQGINQLNTPSLLIHDGDKFEGITQNVLVVDNSTTLSKLSEVIRAPIGLPLDRDSDNERLCSKRRKVAYSGIKDVSGVRKTSEHNCARKVDSSGESCGSSTHTRPNSGNDCLEPRISESLEEKSTVKYCDKIHRRDVAEVKNAGVAPKNGGNSLVCLDSNLRDGSVHCQRLFTCDKGKDGNAITINCEAGSLLVNCYGAGCELRPESDCTKPKEKMVMVHGQEVDAESGRIRNTSSDDHDSCASADARNTWHGFGSKTRGRVPFNNNLEDESVYVQREECGTLNTDELKEAAQTNVVSYANTVNEPNNFTDHRQVFELHRRSRNDSLDSTDESFLPRVRAKFQGDYECMSSPESLSTPSSNRSSNTSSLHGNYSPDTVSLASFAIRFNFGRCEGNKRCSQASTASQDSGRQHWEKIKDVSDLSDGGSTDFARRNSSDHVYQNTPFQAQENFINRSSNINEGTMELEEEIPPPLPVRLCQPSTGDIKAPEVEMIMPYKVVDLEELQKSLDNDMEPYYIHDGSDTTDTDPYNECMDPKPVQPTATGHQNQDVRPALPPKQRSCSQSMSDSTCSPPSTPASPEPLKERPTPLPRQSMILDRLVSDPFVPEQGSESGVMSTDEEMGSCKPTPPASGSRLSRQKSLPVGRVTRSRRDSTSPQKTARPRRSAPPPPPSQSASASDNGTSSRPVSEMFPRPRGSNHDSPRLLKRSQTVSVLHSPFRRIPVEKVNEKNRSSKNCVQESLVTPATLSNGSILTETGHLSSADEKSAVSKEEAAKNGSSKSGAFFGKSNVFKKALTTLKKPVVKKQARRDIVISPPTNFASLYQSRNTADYMCRDRKTVSFMDTAAQFENSSSVPESPTQDAEQNTEESEPQAEEFCRNDEQIYHNFPLSQAIDSPERLLSPVKPPRHISTADSKYLALHDEYLEPCTSQRTRDREDEISQNKLPELGPLPSPPADVSSPMTKDAPTVLNAGQDTEDMISCKTTKPAVKVKPQVPRRPATLKLAKKPPNKPDEQVNKKPKPLARSVNIAAGNSKNPCEPAKRCTDQSQIKLGGTAGRSRSCESLSVDDPHDSYLADMHLTALKDILLRWRNMLRNAAINLAGACWEDFEVVESESWPKVSEAHGSVLQPVKLKQQRLDPLNYRSQFLAKIKSQTQHNSTSKSCYDQDYSVCSSVDPHENVARVLAYFRGNIQSPLLGLTNGIAHVHTTISISDQMPAQTCEEFVSQSVEFHSRDAHSYERTVCLLMLQCFKGLAHLHNAGFTHGHLTLSNMFLIKHGNDMQLYLGNFGKSQPLPKERGGSALNSKSEDQLKLGGLRKDLLACSDVLSAMLHTNVNVNDQNDNLVDHSKSGASRLSTFLERGSARLRDGSSSLYQMIGFLQALLWGPFKLNEDVVVPSESKMKQWLDRQRGEFIAKLAMDEALSRTKRTGHAGGFCMEDLMLCEYLCVANPRSLSKTGKLWFCGGHERLDS